METATSIVAGAIANLIVPLKKEVEALEENIKPVNNRVMKLSEDLKKNSTLLYT